MSLRTQVCPPTTQQQVNRSICIVTRCLNVNTAENAKAYDLWVKFALQIPENVLTMKTDRNGLCDCMQNVNTGSNDCAQRDTKSGCKLTLRSVFYWRMQMRVRQIIANTFGSKEMKKILFYRVKMQINIRSKREKGGRQTLNIYARIYLHFPITDQWKCYKKECDVLVFLTK